MDSREPQTRKVTGGCLHRRPIIFYPSLILQMTGVTPLTSDETHEAPSALRVTDDMKMR
jgi:hypothetical protein